MDIQETKELIRLFSLQPIHSLGQNFLIDDQIVELVLARAEIGSNTLVLEIGPGLGALTRELAAAAGKVVAIEIDRYVLPALRQVLHGRDNVTIIHADARKADLAELAAGWSGDVVVAANLPYYITSPLVEKIFRELPRAGTLLLMVQKEAADRIMAQPGSRQYGPLAVLAAVRGSVDKAARVPRGSFYPQPRVDSVLLCLRRSAESQEIDWPSFAGFLDQSFARRRKTIINSWREAGLDAGRIAHLASQLQDMGLEPVIRPEGIGPEQYLSLFSSLQDRDI